MKTLKINTRLALSVDRNEIVNRVSKERIGLEPRLTKILVLLLKNRGAVVSRKHLVEQVWGNYNSGEDLLTHSVSMLRKNLDTDLIKTIPKKGYLIESSIPLSSSARCWLKNNYWILLVGIFLFVRIFFGHH